MVNILLLHFVCSHIHVSLEIVWNKVQECQCILPERLTRNQRFSPFVQLSSFLQEAFHVLSDTFPQVVGMLLITFRFFSSLFNRLGKVVERCRTFRNKLIFLKEVTKD